MAPGIAKIDPDRPLELGMPAWNFSNEVLRWLLHGNSLSPFERLARPISRQQASRFAVARRTIHMRAQAAGGNHLVFATIRLIMVGAIRNIMGSNLT
jgi:hypothetical protein